MARFDPLTGQLIQERGVPYISSTANPTTSDIQPVGSIIINSATKEAFILVSLDGGIAEWKPFTGGSGGGGTPVGDASTTVKGIAKFDGTDFTVTGGLVEINAQNLAFDNTGTLLQASTLQAAVKELWEAQIDYNDESRLAFTAEVDKGYTLTATSAQTEITLPATAPRSSTITFFCTNPNGFRVKPAPGQKIGVFNTTTTPGGFIEFTEFGSEVTLTCYEADTSWYIRSPSGNLNIT